jgi:hypothetical protein
LEGSVYVFVGKDEVATRIIVNDDVVLVVESVGDSEPQLFRLVLAGLGDTRPEFEAEGGVQADFLVEAVGPTWVQAEVGVGMATVGTDGKNGVSLRCDFLEDLWVGAIVGTDFAVIVNRVEGNLRLRTIECLESREIGLFAYDLHFFGVALGPIADETGQAVVVAKTKVAKEEEPHFFLEGGGEWLYVIWASWFRLV